MKLKHSILFLFATLFLSNACFSTDVCPGVSYENIVLKNPNLSIHVATIDPEKACIAIKVASDKCNSTAKVSDLAKENDALIAINAGFWDFGQKNVWLDRLVKLLDYFGINFSNTFPVLCLKNKDKWFSLSNKNSGIVGWQNGGKIAKFGTTQITWQLKIDEKLFPIADINKPYAQGPILYTSAYDLTTKSKSGVTEFVVREGNLSEIICKDGGATIPENGFVYAVEHQFLNKIELSCFVVGKPVLIVKTYSDEACEWDNMEYLLGSTPLLIKDGQMTPNVLNSQSGFYIKCHPRTAIGILENGDWVLIVVDGRQSHSCGMTILELAQFLKNFGCKFALNLDGGGSSVMVVNKEVVNSPSGREWSVFKGERYISNSIMVLKHN